MLRAVANRVHGLGLVARFTIIGALVGVLVAGAVAWFVDSRLTDLMLDQVAGNAVDQVNLGVLGRVTLADFEPPYTPEKLDDLDKRLSPVLSRVREAGSGVIRLHLFARDGTVLLSDLPSKRGQVLPPGTSRHLADAFAGSLGKDISSLSALENADLKARYGSAMEVYVPFALDGRVVGAYEIYQDLEPIRPVRPLVWSLVLGGFALLFLALLLVVRGAAAQIRRQQAERERLLQKAAEAEALRELDRLKDELISVVSHELRAPLASVVGFADLLLMRDYPESERRRLLTIISEEGQRLAELVSDFLDLQRMEIGRQMVQLAPAEPRILLERAIAAAGDDAERPIILDVAGELPLVHADGDRVQQVLVNLLSNARKYSPNGGEVRISASPVEGAIEISVRDHGLGLPSDALPHLFEKFYRVAGSDRRGISGTGLGLAICKKIVELHGGRIWVESDGPGLGSRFCFTLPLVEAGATSHRGAGAEDGGAPSLRRGQDVSSQMASSF